MKITRIKPEKLSGRVLLASKLFIGKHSVRDELPMIIRYDHSTNRAGIAIGYSSHWHCVQKTKEYTTTPKVSETEVTKIHCDYDPKTHALRLNGINHLPVETNGPIYTRAIVSLVMHLTKKHKLPVLKVLSLKLKTPEYNTSDLMPLKEALGTIRKYAPRYAEL